jgi:D-beta-D-heptose 7-phosphate kinase/D-beta-D-heptose 1-phosphate adenosyltransferase
MMMYNEVEAVVADRWKIRKVLDLISEAHGSLTTVFTNGCFDVLHPGHIACLRWARKQGDVLVVGLNSDSSVRRLKGSRRPIMNEHDRAIVLASVCYVDFVSVFDEETPEDLIRVIRPNVLVKGSEYRDKPVAGREFVKSCGGTMAYFDMVPSQSSTSIFERVVKALTGDDLVDELNEREEKGEHGVQHRG